MSSIIFYIISTFAPLFGINIPPISDELWLNKRSRRKKNKRGKNTSLAFISYLKAVNKRPSNQQAAKFSGQTETRAIS